MLSEIELAAGLARSTLRCITHEHQEMGKGSARLVPKFPTAAQSCQQGVDACSDLLSCHDEDQADTMVTRER